jgi:DNA mismatch repair protein MutH
VSTEQITLGEGLRRLQKLSGSQLTFEELWQLHGNGKTFDSINKGGPGQMVELMLGMENSSRHIDFIDGELKSSGMKIDDDDKIIPRETLAVTNISSRIDTMLSVPSFRNSFLHEKIKNTLLVPVIQPEKADRASWYLGTPHHVRVVPGSAAFLALEKDFRLICKKLLDEIRAGGRVRTTSGHYLQIRTKDSKPYHPIYSDKFSRYVSEKNYAFYLQKPFIEDVLAGRL